MKLTLTILAFCSFCLFFVGGFAQSYDIDSSQTTEKSSIAELVQFAMEDLLLNPMEFSDDYKSIVPLYPQSHRIEKSTKIYALHEYNHIMGSTPKLATLLPILNLDPNVDIKTLDNSYMPELPNSLFISEEQYRKIGSSILSTDSLSMKDGYSYPVIEVSSAIFFRDGINGQFWVGVYLTPIEYYGAGGSLPDKIHMFFNSGDYCVFYKFDKDFPIAPKATRYSMALNTLNMFTPTVAYTISVDAIELHP